MWSYSFLLIAYISLTLGQDYVSRIDAETKLRQLNDKRWSKTKPPSFTFPPLYNPSEVCFNPLYYGLYPSMMQMSPVPQPNMYYIPKVMDDEQKPSFDTFTYPNMPYWPSSYYNPNFFPSFSPFTDPPAKDSSLETTTEIYSKSVSPAKPFIKTSFDTTTEGTRKAKEKQDRNTERVMNYLIDLGTKRRKMPVKRITTAKPIRMNESDVYGLPKKTYGVATTVPPTTSYNKRKAFEDMIRGEQQTLR